MLTMSDTVAPMGTICTGFSRPTSSGPMTVPPPSSCSSLEAMLARVQRRHDQHIGRARQAAERIELAHQLGSSATSAAISPSYSKSTLRRVEQRRPLRGCARPSRAADCRRWRTTAAPPAGHGRAARALAAACVGDVGELFRHRQLVDRRVGDEHRAPARDQHRQAEERARPAARIEHAADVVQRHEVGAREAGDQRVGIAVAPPCRRRRRCGPGSPGAGSRATAGRAAAGAVEEVDVGLRFSVESARCGSRSLDVRDADFLHLLAHEVLAADQDRRCRARRLELGGGADGLLLLALGEDHAARVGAHLVEDQLQRPAVGSSRADSRAV